MNSFIKAQINNTITMLENFKTGVKLASYQDDGTMDKSEKKMIEKIYKETDKYIAELEKIK